MKGGLHKDLYKQSLDMVLCRFGDPWIRNLDSRDSIQDEIISIWAVDMETDGKHRLEGDKVS